MYDFKQFLVANSWWKHRNIRGYESTTTGKQLVALFYTVVYSVKFTCSCKVCLRCMELPLVVNVSLKSRICTLWNRLGDIAIHVLYSVYTHYSARLFATMHEDHYFSLLVVLNRSMSPRRGDMLLSLNIVKAYNCMHVTFLFSLYILCFKLSKTQAYI